MVFDSRMKPLVGDAGCCGEILQDDALPFMHDKHVISSGPRLLMRRFPLAIVQTVTLLYSLSAETFTFGALAHVAQECLKTLSPFFAHRYSALAVMLILFIVWIEASALCVRPRFIGSRLSALRGVAMLEASISGFLSFYAAATGRFFDAIKVHWSDRAAIAFDHPECPPTDIFSTLQRYKTTKSLIRDIYCSHNAIPLFVNLS